jgi:putative multiple sugar transport system substrate-binding protein
MKKKLLAVLLCIALVSSFMVGCQGADGGKQKVGVAMPTKDLHRYLLP